MSFTVADAMAAYFKDAERRGTKGIAQDRYRAKWILESPIASVQVSELTRGDIEAWLDKMAKSAPRRRTGGNPNKYQPPKGSHAPQTDEEKRARKASANRVFAIFSAAMNHAIASELAESAKMPWRWAKKFKGVTKSRDRFLTIEEQQKLVKACPPDFGLLVQGALATGCRHGELARLKVRDYDAENKSVFIATSKSGKPRHIYLSEDGCELFDMMTLGRGKDEIIFERVFGARTRQPKPWMAKEHCKLMEAACAKAGIPKAVFHELRHTYASMLVNAGCMLTVVAKQLGHRDTTMVERHYGHLANDTVRNELARTMPRLGLTQGVTA